MSIQPQEELRAIEQRFKVSLGEGPFLFEIGPNRHMVMRVGLASSDGHPVLVVTGPACEDFVAGIDDLDRRKQTAHVLSEARVVALPQTFEGIPVMAWGDDS